MRKTLCFVVVSGLIAFSSNSSQAGPEMLTNRGMTALCETSFAIENQPPPPEEAGKLFEAGLCQGYVTGIAEALHMQNIICLKQLDTPLVVKVYTTWVKNNPQKEPDRSIDGVTESLKNAYPCDESRPVPPPAALPGE